MDTAQKHTLFWASVGLAAVGVYRFFAMDSATQAAIDGTDDTGETGMSKGTIQLRLTTYHPFAATALGSNATMEGGVTDFRGRPLQTVEDFFSGAVQWVSLSGDPNVWPDGQAIQIPWGSRTILGRVVDTGEHFTDLVAGKKFVGQKVYRALGYEPIDVCVRDPATVPSPNKVVATIVVGDNWGKSKLGHAQNVQSGYVRGQEIDLG